MKINKVPNYISISRIILSLTLFFAEPLSAAFYSIYIICGFSDIFDGIIARKTGTTSTLGAKLDSVADLVMTCVLLIVLYPVINPSTEVIIWVISIAAVRFAAMFTALKKYKTFASIHTYGNKITGMVLFISPILLSFMHANVLIYMICAIASISAIEELMIQLTSRKLQLNRQSIFVKN